jgi:predicted O-methyltransferase YrrM
MSEQKRVVKEAVDRINNLVRGFMASNVLFTAVDGDVFTLLEEETTARRVASATGWDARATRMLLDGLVAIGLVTKVKDKYRNTPEASMTLVTGSPGYQGHIVKHMKHISRSWARLTEAVQTGTGVATEFEERPDEEVRAFILGMKDISRFSAKEMLGVLDLSRYRHLLDLGTGPGTYGITFLETYPEMRATLFDRPEVLEIAREEVAKAGLEERVNYRAGDMTLTDLGFGYDLVLLSNIIHAFGPATNRRLFKRIHESMSPGGLLIIKDFVVDDDRTGPAFGLMFALNMLVGTGEGDTYTFAELSDWTNEAGFKKGKALDLTPQTRLWMVEK